MEATTETPSNGVGPHVPMSTGKKRRASRGTGLETKFIDYLRTHNAATVPMICEATGIQKSSAWNIAARMVKRGTIKKLGSKDGVGTYGLAVKTAKLAPKPEQTPKSAKPAPKMARGKATKSEYVERAAKGVQTRRRGAETSVAELVEVVERLGAVNATLQALGEECDALKSRKRELMDELQSRAS